MDVRNAPTTPADTVFLVAGLGNPGSEYEDTRHNAGFHVLEALAKRIDVRLRISVRFGFEARGRIESFRVLLLKPNTFMNRSGLAVTGVMRREEIPPERLIVIHDDLDLPVGSIRIKKTGGHGGHRGIGSIIECLGSRDFSRIKVGIGRPPGRIEPAEYVLMKPRGSEKTDLAIAFEHAADAVERLLQYGVDVAMNECNRRVEPADGEESDV